MKIRAVINGKEIIGNWNGKFYKAKQEGKFRIYIDNKEYIVDENFDYEEVLTEKQKQYAKELKEKFLEKLELLLYDLNIDEDIMKKIITYFEELNNEWYLKNKGKLENILNIAFTYPVMLSKIINDENLINEFEVVEKLGLDDKTKNEIVRKLALKSVLEYSNIPVQFVIKEKNGKYRVVVKGKIDTIIFIINKDLEIERIERIV